MMPPPVPLSPPAPFPVPVLVLVLVLVLVPVPVLVAPAGRGSSIMTPTRGMLAGLTDEGSPFAAGRRTCRSHQSSSAVISNHQGPSGAIRGHPGPSGAIRGHQRPSEAIRGHQGPSGAISRHQPSSAVISRHQGPWAHLQLQMTADLDARIPRDEIHERRRTKALTLVAEQPPIDEERREGVTRLPRTQALEGAAHVVKPRRPPLVGVTAEFVIVRWRAPKRRDWPDLIKEAISGRRRSSVVISGPKAKGSAPPDE